jgi:hypothetical protein
MQSQAIEFAGISDISASWLLEYVSETRKNHHQSSKQYIRITKNGINNYGGWERTW